jgi:hypothetical protein
MIPGGCIGVLERQDKLSEMLLEPPDARRVDGVVERRDSQRQIQQENRTIGVFDVF